MQKQNSKIKNSKLVSGFTLVEMIMVIAIFSVLLFAIAGFFIMTIQSRGKSQARIEVQEQARTAIERVAYDIRRATSTTLALGANVNVATGSASFNLISSVASRNPTIFTVSNGILYVKYGTGSTTALTSKDVTINSLIFTNLSSTNGRSKNILVNMIFTKADPTGKTSSDINYPIETTVEIMGK